MEYVEIPPASLSTFEVMNPGPTTAMKSASRRQSTRVLRGQRFSFFRSASIRGISVFRSMTKPIPEKLTFRFASVDFCGEPSYNVVHGNRADWHAVLIHHTKNAQIIFIEQLQNFFLARVGRQRQQRLGLQRIHRLSCRRQK